MTFGLTVQELIDALNTLSPKEKTMYIVGDKDIPLNTVTRHWLPKKYLGHCIKVSTAQISWKMTDYELGYKDGYACIDPISTNSEYLRGHEDGYSDCQADSDPYGSFWEDYFNEV